MAKDPAMLWYWSDWYSGTATLSRFLKGCYMDIMHAQFNSGHLSLEEIKTVLGSDFGTAWPALQKKFSTDATGNFFNVRLEEEKIKRANFTQSRRDNLKSPHKATHITHHMTSHMENVNENKNTIEYGLKKEYQISIKKVYAADKIKIIYDLQTYFSKSIDQLERAGWTRFDDFMKANPARIFDDDDHLYHAFKKFHEGKNNGKQKITYEDVA